MRGKTDRPGVVRIILGSVPPELGPERAAVERALTHLRESAFPGLEWLSFNEHDVTSATPGEVAQCQVYISLLSAQGPAIHFEPEYRRASQHSLHCLVYSKGNPTAASKRRRGKPKPPPTPSSFAAELIRSDLAVPFSDPDDLKAKVTADLNRWLSGQHLVSRTENAAQPEVPQYATSAHVISAVGRHGIAVGRDIVSSTLITGNHNIVYQAIVQLYPALKDYAIDFDDLIKKATERFVGRKEFFERLGQFPKQHPCGYFRVVADAGLGKTALAAAVAKRLKAPAFFANASRGLTRSDQGLNHLAVELIARFCLAHDHLPARAGDDSAFFGRVLAEAASKSHGPLWIVVDALDEADTPGPGRNPLLLPDRLPKYIYILLTHRPDEISIATDSRTANEEYRIASNDAAQQTDVVTYLNQEAKRTEIRRAREEAKSPITIAQFVDVLQRKSEGNFKYLDYVLADIAARQPGFEPLNLEALPRGLRGYYQQFWRQMEHVRGQDGGWTEWRDLYRPAIAFLAASREAVPASWLAALIGRPTTEIEERALKRWRRFLSHEDRNRPHRWRVVHQSFVDFLGEEEMVDLRDAHDQVATYYLNKWGGLDEGLPALFDSARSEQQLDGYGLQHLVEHLERACRVEDLHRLMRLERRDGGVETRAFRAENAWYAAHEHIGQTSGYMNDLARAARLLEQDVRPHVGSSQLKTCIGLEIRYALTSTSLNSLARNIPPRLTVALVEKLVWLRSHNNANAWVLQPNRAQAQIRTKSNPNDWEKETVLQEALDAEGIGDAWSRANALAKLAPRLAELGQVEAALQLARGIRDETARAGALAALAPRLAELGQVEAALAVAREIGAERSRAGALAELAPHLARLGRAEEALELARGIGSEVTRARALATLGRVKEALEAVREIEGEWVRAKTLATLAPHLAALGRVEEALEVARGIGDKEDRTYALAKLGHLEEALAVARGIGEYGARASALATVALQLAELGQISEALAVARRIGAGEIRASVMAELAPRLAQIGQVEAALELARGIEYKTDRVRALAALGRLSEAIDTARGIRSEETRARSLEEMAPHLSEPGQVEAALELTRGIGHEPYRTFALEVLAPHMSEPYQVEAALELARGIGDKKYRSGALAALASRLGELGDVEAALAVARGIGDKEEQALALAALGRLKEALAVVRGIRDEWARTHALSVLGQVEASLTIAGANRDEWEQGCVRPPVAPHMSEPSQVEALLDVARSIGDQWEQARALALLAPQLGELGQVKAALEMAQGIGSEGARARALSAIAPQLADLPRGQALSLWRATLRLSTTRWRRDLLADLAALAPVILVLGGFEAITETCLAIEDVGRWWP
jgi:hypothetical protein